VKRWWRDGGLVDVNVKEKAVAWESATLWRRRVWAGQTLEKELFLGDAKDNLPVSDSTSIPTIRQVM
jgi:hypothetical protein